MYAKRVCRRTNLPFLSRAAKRRREREREKCRRKGDREEESERETDESALEVDRGNALPLASIFFTLLLGGRRPPYPSPPFLLLPPCHPPPYVVPLRSPIESIKALGSGITCNRVSRSPKTRKRLVFSVDRSFSRLSVCVRARARAHHRCFEGAGKRKSTVLGRQCYFSKDSSHPSSFLLLHLHLFTSLIVLLRRTMRPYILTHAHVQHEYAYYVCHSYANIRAFARIHACIHICIHIHVILPSSYTRVSPSSRSDFG